MPDSAAAAMTRIVSADGVRIAVFVSGHGRPLVVVPGTTSDHTTWRFILPLLEPHVTVHAVDRRGRGDSEDAADYSLEREYADVAAVVDAAAAASGSAVDVLGHSYGGNIAFGAAALTSRIRKLVLYEGWPVPDIADRTIPPATLARLHSLLAQGRPDAMLERFYRDIVQMSDDEFASVRTAPTWPSRVAAAHTVPRELTAFAEQAFDPDRAARIAVPVLLLVGSESPDAIRADPQIVAAALPDARIGLLDGQGHIAHLTAPQYFTDVVLSFLRS